MRPVDITLTTVTSSAWVPLDTTQNPASISIGCRVIGTATYGVEYTYDDPFNTTPVAFGYLTQIPSGSTANKDVIGLTGPVRAVRLTTAAVTGGGVKMTVLQGLGL